MKITTTALLSGLLCFTFLLPAQEPEFEFQEITLPGEFSSNQIQDIQQDAQGFLWFASAEGAHRFDGNNYKTFVHEENNLRSLKHSYIELLYKTKDGRFWLASYGGGLHLYHPETEDFSRFHRIPGDPTSLSSDSIMSMVEGPNGYLWIGTMNGLNRFDPKSGKVKRYMANPADPNSLCYARIPAVYIDKEGTLWVGSGWIWNDISRGQGGLHRYVPEEDKFIRYRHDPNDPKSLRSNDIWCMLEDSKGNFWVGTHGDGLHLMDRDSGSFQHFPYTSDNQNKPMSPFMESKEESRGYLNTFGVRRLMEDREGRIWILGIQSGFGIWDPNTQTFTQYNTTNSSLSTNRLWGFSQIPDGSFYIYSGGQSPINVKLHSPKTKARILSLPQAAEDFNKLQVIAPDPKGNLWVGGNTGGILGFQPGQSNVLLHFQNHSNRKLLTDDDIHDIIIEKDGKIWAAGWHKGGGLSRIDSRNKKSDIYLKDEGLGGDPIPVLLLDSKNNLWVGTEGRGLKRYLREEDRFKAYFPEAIDSISSFAQNIYNLAETKDGHIWLLGGKIESTEFHPSLIEYIPEKEEFEFAWISGEYFPPFTQSCWSLQEDKNGDLWFVFGSGINRYDRSEEKMYSYPIFSQTPSVNWLQISKAGLIYIGKQDQIYRFNPETEELLRLPVFSKSNENSFTMGPTRRFSSLGEDELWPIMWGNQILLFDPVQWDNYQTTEEAKLYLHKVLSQGKDNFEIGDINQLDEINLEESEFPLSILAHAFHFKEGGINKIRYRYPPFETNWLEIESGKRIHLPKLTEGSYQLEIQAKIPFGSWASDRNIYINVSPPWYLSSWGMLIIGIGILGILSSFFLIYFRTQAKKIARQEEELDRERKLNEKLRNIDQLKDQFLANTSHELRTPLNGIIGLSEALIETEDQAEKRENLEMIISSGKRLSTLVNDILDFSKLRTHEIVLRKKAIDLHSLVKLVLRIHKPLVGKKELTLENNIPPDLPPVEADEDRLQQILFNLVGNAIKFTESGKVSIGHQAISENQKALGNSELTLFISDTGIGIPEEKRESIFQAFEQADASISREFAGTGLGLSISKRLVELHGGQMWVESEVGKGSTFYVSLPFASAAAKASKVEQLLPEFSPSINPAARDKAPLSDILSSDSLIHILVVDDEPINQQVIKNHLGSNNYQLTHAMNGEEAMKALENNPHFDLVLLDVMMPRMSGYEVCQKIREKFLPSELPIIMITAKNQIADLVESLHTGANDYIAKPFSKDEFLARVETHLNLHKINTVTNRFVPTEFIKSLGKKTLTELQLGDQVEQQVSVLFADIRNYTGLAESMSPEENFRFVNAYAGRMGPIIQENNGFVNQYLGDGIMAIFQKSPDDALKASIAMQKELEIYNKKRKTQKRRAVRAGIGLHSGSLIMGIIGDKKRTDAATISDTVNTASRMESLTKHFGVNILLSEDCVSRLQHPEEFNLRYLGKVKVKGKSIPQGVYDCFDGDRADQIEKKSASLADFNKALEVYFAQEFAEAALLLKEIIAKNPEDAPAHHFYKLAGQFITQGVSEDWTGVESMGHK
ncbi:MAG: two-component regulator propeller domain-containing protein [Bacteroidia bacterium]|nr:two-component regulator propeller domain-containing protein [Bacteroidia bacterium]